MHISHVYMYMCIHVTNKGSPSRSANARNDDGIDNVTTNRNSAPASDLDTGKPSPDATRQARRPSPANPRNHRNSPRVSARSHPEKPESPCTYRGAIQDPKEAPKRAQKSLKGPTPHDKGPSQAPRNSRGIVSRSARTRHDPVWVLYYIILYDIILYYIILYHNILYHII